MPKHHCWASVGKRTKMLRPYQKCHSLCFVKPPVHQKTSKKKTALVLVSNRHSQKFMLVWNLIKKFARCAWEIRRKVSNHEILREFGAENRQKFEQLSSFNPASTLSDSGCVTAKIQITNLKTFKHNLLIRYSLYLTSMDLLLDITDWY